MNVNKEWIFKNWRWIFFITLLIFTIPTLLVSFIKTDNDLWYSDQRKKLSEKLAAEMKSIDLPQKTAVNSFNNSSKPHQVFILTRYRTELNEKDFVDYFIRELEKRNWVFYGKEDGEYKFCRGKFDASIFYENSGGIFGDGGNYYKISFSKGLRPLLDFSDSRPESCQ